MGGFILVKILMHESQGYNFFEAFTFSFALVTVLHFVGSCMQYGIGRIKAVQKWANFALPTDMLAASDSVLGEANCLMVGIVGQVFMDTLNGLNQGRMNMDFCTQFWSEYASIPTAFSWVATGAVLSVQGESGYDWADEAVPLCVLMAGIWQFVGTTFGGHKLLQANGDEKFWKSKEKWETVQYFSKIGVRATTEGWKNDCFCLVKKHELDSCLFERIKPVHEDYMASITEPQPMSGMSTPGKNPESACSKSVRDKILQKRYNSSRRRERMAHWSNLEKKYFVKKVDQLCVAKPHKNWFVTFEVESQNTRQDVSGEKEIFGKHIWQFMTVLIAALTGCYSYLKIAKDIETEEVVQGGLEALKDVSGLAWGVFAVYNIIVLMYYRRSCFNSIYSGWYFTLNILRCKCCKSEEQNLETVFRQKCESESVEYRITRI